ncbi:MAG TPA: ABC transporter permease [Anaerolineales bacterium]|nr:ABC transporter permease [Anaerolineales bacterium]
MSERALSTPPVTATSLRSGFSTFKAMVRKELILMVRYPVNFIASFGQIFLIVAILSLGGRTFSANLDNPPPIGAPPTSGNPSGVVIYGFILFMFLSDTLWTIGYNVRHEQVQGTLEQLYLSPASKFASLVSRVANILLWTGLLTLAASGLMVLMIGRLPVENPWLGLYLLVMSLAGTFGIGFAFAALTLRIRETAQTMANLLQFVFLILCANFFPFSALPPVLLRISRLIPLSYSVDAFRSTLMNYPPGYPELAPISVEIVIVTLFGIGMPFLGYYLYRRAEDHARRSGSLSSF